MKELIDAVEASLELSGYRWKRLNDVTLIVGVELEPQGFEVSADHGLFTVVYRRQGTITMEHYQRSDIERSTKQINRLMDIHLNSLNVFS